MLKGRLLAQYGAQLLNQQQWGETKKAQKQTNKKNPVNPVINQVTRIKCGNKTGLLLGCTSV